MSKTSNKQKLECLRPYLEWLKKQPNYPRKRRKQSPEE